MKIVKESPCVCPYSPEVIIVKYVKMLDFPDGSVAKNPPASAGDLGSILALGRSPGEGNGNPVFLLGNPLNRGAWQATVHGVIKSWARPSG